MCFTLQGGNLWKHGRQGKPKVHYFHLTDADACLTWMSKDTKNRSIRLREIENVRRSLITDQARANPGPSLQRPYCFRAFNDQANANVKFSHREPNTKARAGCQCLRHCKQFCPSAAAFRCGSSSLAADRHRGSLTWYPADCPVRAADMGSGDGDLQAVPRAGTRAPVLQRHVSGGRLPAIAGPDLRDRARLRVLVFRHQGVHPVSCPEPHL